MGEDEAAGFAAEPAFESALLLRRCDDRGKDVEAQARTIEDYRGLLMGSLRPDG
jgi:hypothetical protein